MRNLKRLAAEGLTLIKKGEDWSRIYLFFFILFSIFLKIQTEMVDEIIILINIRIKVKDKNNIVLKNVFFSYLLIRLSNFNKMISFHYKIDYIRTQRIIVKGIIVKGN